MDASARRVCGLVAGAALTLAALTACAGGGAEPGASATTSSAATSSAAATTGPTGPDRQALVAFLTSEFEADDENGDGALDADEAAASIASDFTDSDVTGDGVLTLADVQQELDAADGGTVDQPLGYYLAGDADGDDRITREEYVEAVNRDVMTPMDADSDGEVTLEEALAWHVDDLAGAAS